MKLTDLNIKKINLKDIDSLYPGQEILFKLGELYQFESGIYGYGNILTKLEKKVEEIIIDQLDKAGCIEVKFPILQPKQIWTKSDRWENYTTVSDTMFTLNNNLGEYGLAPTAEECAIIFASNRLQSERNLPATYYQINEKFRKEIRTRGYLFRSREFKMLDAYSFDKDESSLEVSYDKIKQAYIKIFERLGIKVIPIAAENGSFGGSKSEEWMAITNIGEDTILFDGNIGLNTEILEKDNYMEYLKQEYNIADLNNMKEYKTMELGHTFMLGKNYSETMDLKFTDSNNQLLPYYMGCYGIGIERIYITIIENSVIRNDDNTIKGLSLPLEIAPYKIQIVYKDDKTNLANDLYNQLLSNNISCIIDDRANYSLGNKIKDAYVLGTPLIIIIGNNSSNNQFEVEDTKTGNKQILSVEEIISKLKDHN